MGASFTYVFVLNSGVFSDLGWAIKFGREESCAVGCSGSY